MVKPLLFFVSLFFVLSVSSQTLLQVSEIQTTPHKSIVQEQSEYYQSLNITSEEQLRQIYIEQNGVAPEEKQLLNKTNSVCTLNKRVFGWHPWWNSSGVQNNYQWNLLSDFCYFNYEVSPSTGQNTNTQYFWTTAQSVTDAKANGAKIHLCATMFGSHSTFWGSSTAQQTFITNMVNAMNARGANGVNIDFEGMGTSDKAPFAAFMQNLNTQLKAANPNYELSMALYAVEWSSTFDIALLNNCVDTYIIMGYDYYYAGSTTAGPEAPLYNFEPGYNRTLSRSITWYLNQGIPNSKLLLGLPWYGREWETVGNTAPSATTGGATSTKFFSAVKNNPNGFYSAANKRWDANSFNPYYVYQVAGAWRQCFIDDAYSMEKKFDLVNQRGIGGIGIWALSYDDGYMDYWNAIEKKFSTCATVACTDTIYDMGGPNRAYYDNERYTYTIAPTGASKVNLNFTSFNLELNYDSLWLYDGPSTSSPLIGKYTGTASPGNITSTGNAITLKFKSDGATTTAGFQAIWQCIIDNVVPTTTVSAPPAWATQDFTTNFTDADNVGGTGIEKSFYQVLNYNGTEWRANNQRGFFSDNFDTAIHPDWTNAAGNWSIASTFLTQTDETLSNTNLWAACNQTLSNRYLYNWQAKMDGAGTNRRAGFHFFCDDATQTNRGNSYFAWFRLDQDMVEIYKVTANTFGTPVKSAPFNFTANTFNDYKVTFDRVTGEIEIWIDNVFVTSYTDSSPHTVGNHIAFRSGNCIFTVNDLKVYRSRASSTTITVGAGNTDLSFQNPNPSTPAGRIKSIVKDNSDNLSLIDSKDVNVDYTKPICSGSLSDGLAADMDSTTSTTQLSANWSAATDTHSGISSYEYAIGTTPGASNVVPWTTNATNTNFSATGLSLVVNQMYYVSIRAINGAGLVCDSVTSDGVKVVSTVGINEYELNNFVLAPNPSANSFVVSGSFTKAQVKVFNTVGEIIYNDSFTNKLQVNCEAWAKGIYLVEVSNGTSKVIKRFVKN